MTPEYKKDHYMCEVSLHRVIGSQGYTHTIPYSLKTNKNGGGNKETSLKMISL